MFYLQDHFRKGMRNIFWDDAVDKIGAHAETKIECAIWLPIQNVIGQVQNTLSRYIKGGDDNE